MIQIIMLLVYVGICYWVGLRGAATRAGFLGTMLLSLLVTPVMIFILLYAFAPANEKEPAAPQTTAAAE
jgi:hypothetical protein